MPLLSNVYTNFLKLFVNNSIKNKPFPFYSFPAKSNNKTIFAKGQKN